MWQSLLYPKLFPTSRSDQFLCEYRLYQHRLGYFPVTRLADKLVVRTFLFLTMQGTPEQRKLCRQLGLMRAKIEATELDQLGLFLTTDIQTDPVLRKLFAKCGCGHLLDMVKPEFREQCRKGYAEDLRRYLRIDDRAAREI